ncbi:MAG: 5-(carboxyamino)imidazole ribonucleotide synthase [Planctomycetes bacterium]|nr:5-(carboxyamino)imidazole ribonucleotide synthase [Planctomycetota bacterium]
MLIGCLGGGQLGRMLALAALPLDVRLRVYDPDPSACAGHCAEHVRGEWSDEAVLTRFCAGLDACTFEFENVPAGTLEFVAARVPTFPGPMSLTTGQDRANEKVAFTQVGFDVPPYVLVENAADLAKAITTVGVPGVLKARRGGYDGKGQAVIRDAAMAQQAWESIGSRPAVYEAFVPFARELSIIACRGRDGAIVHYPIAENVHKDGILHVSFGNGSVEAGVATQARERITALLNRLQHVGVLAIEMFEVRTAEGVKLIPNEMAPRVHNTGHWTIEGSVTSQFENHMRAVAGLPLGTTAMAAGATRAAMVNLIGAVPPSVQIARTLLQLEGAHLHLYGKEPRQGRKVGHVTWVGDERVCDRARKIAQQWPPC